jgi:hypothetical protein
MGQKKLAALVAAIAFAHSSAARADTVDARCDIYPRGEDHTDKVIPCTFSQRQGYVFIRRSDGIVHDLSPVGDRPGNFRDQDGRRVYRESGLGDAGQIYRLPDESVYVYWSTAALEAPADEDSFSAPFTTVDYDATTRLRCRAPGDSEFGSCPAGILRMENGQASIVVQNQFGEQFTMNFMKDAQTGEPYVNATNREVEARMRGDTWIVTINGEEVWEVPLAAVEGG